MANSLSGRFLILTIIFVMLAEIFIFVPSIARFREDYLLARLERAQIASLALLATDGMIDDALEAELLENAGVLNVVLRRDEARQLILASNDIQPVSYSFDLRSPTGVELVRDALRRLLRQQDETIRVIGEPVREAGLLIEVTMRTAPLRAEMLDYGLRILVLSAMISIFTAALLFIAVQRLLVVPIKRLVFAMTSYADAPEDASRILEPRASVRELREAESTLQTLQTQLTASLRQRERLAQLGEAVAKISHDLRNILTTATLMADRLDTSTDPAVQRTTPKLVASLTRAVNLTEATLAFGRAEEPPPKLERFALSDLAEDVIENERLTDADALISYGCDVPNGMILRADPEQLHRVLSNLVRNARQAIAAHGVPGEISIQGRETEDGWCIRVADTGPGLPKKARDHLFKPFHGGARKGGSGLGLAIAAEIVRGHGGRLELVETGPDGTVFSLFLPSGVASLP
ncbi:Sensor histidine kinase in cluster with mercury reductase [Roseibacterium elongatum DSM 19469]|uniref:histidine kinase n=1 Tax=Roseicyclus elongatus DSM 19469 TaxID=1294273 RepID=W8SNA6_9RHOB|nr:HAMP domain-containing sensor histidine kinase [Roseibacterium elongatum]AHM03995.1 Sensor histidine kinase in cluster with mercury reductase [Roseibacterium elongatum DSM 19469]